MRITISFHAHFAVIGTFTFFYVFDNALVCDPSLVLLGCDSLSFLTSAIKLKPQVASV